MLIQWQELFAMPVLHWKSFVNCSSRREPMPKNRKPLPPVHPGEILREDLMKPLALSINGWREIFVCLLLV